MPNKKNNKKNTSLKKSNTPKASIPLNQGSNKNGEDKSNKKSPESDLPRASIPLNNSSDDLNLEPESTPGYDLSEYTPYTGPINVEAEDPIKERAEAQGFGSEIGTATLNIAPNILAGLGEKTGYIYEQAARGLGYSDDFGNALSEFSKEFKNPAGRVYRENPESVFDPSDSASYINSISSVAESVGEFYLLGAGIGGVLGKGAQGIANSLKAGATGHKIAQTGAQAATSFELAESESFMTAGRLQKKQYRKYRAEGLSHEEALRKSAEEANKARWFNSAIVGALNMTSIAPLFKSSRKLRQANRAGLTRRPDEGYKSYLSRVEQTVDNPQVKKTLREKYGLAFEAGQEALEEDVNLFSREVGKGGATFQDFIDTTLSAEGAHSMALGALGGVGQAGLMNRMPSQRRVKRDEQGNPMMKDEENYKYEMVSPHRLDKEAKQTQAFNVAEELRDDLKEIDSAHEELKSAIEQGKGDEEIEKAKKKLFNVTAKRSIQRGTADNLKATYDQIASYDNNQMDENGQTEAMRKGVAESPSDNDYVQKAQEAKKDIDEFTKMYNDAISRHDYPDEEASGLGEKVFALEASRYQLGKHLQELEKKKTEVENRPHRDPKGYARARDLSSKAQAINDLKKEIEQDTKDLEDYKNTKEDKRSEEQKRRFNELKSKYGVENSTELGKSIQNAKESLTNKAQEFEKEISELKKNDPQLESKVEEAAKGDKELDEINKSIERTKAEIDALNSSIDRITSSKGRKEFVENTKKEAKERSESIKEYQDSRKNKNKEAIKNDLRKADSIDDLNEVISKANEFDPDQAPQAIEEVYDEQKKSAPKFDKDNASNRYSNRPLLFLNEMEQFQGLAQKAYDDGVISEDSLESINNNIDSPESFEALYDNATNQSNESQPAEEVRYVIDEFLDGKNKQTDETSNPQTNEEADPEGSKPSDPSESDSEEDLGDSDQPSTQYPVEKDFLEGGTFSESVPAIEMEKDSSNQLVRDEDGNPKPLLDDSGNPVPSKIGQIAQIDFDYLDSPQGLQNGDTIQFEVDREIFNNDFHNKLKGEDLVNQFLIQIVSYDSGGNRRVVGVVPAYRPKASVDYRRSNKLKNLRRAIFNELNADTSGGKIFKSSYSSKVSDKARGRFRTVNKKQDPRSVLVKPDGKGSYDFILGVGRAGSEGDNVWLDTAGLADEANTRNAEKGKAYMIVPASNGNNIPAKIRIRNLNDQHQFIKEKKGDSYESLRDQAVTILKNINNENYKSSFKALNNLMLVDGDFQDGKVRLFSGNFEERNESKSVEKPDVVINPSESVESIEEKIGTFASKVDVSKINRENYNDNIAEEGRIYTDLRPSIFTHSSKFNTGEVTAETNNIPEDPSPSETEGSRSPTDEDRGTAVAMSVKTKGEDSLPSETEESPSDSNKKVNTPKRSRSRVKPGANTSNINVSQRQDPNRESPKNPFKYSGYKTWNKDQELEWFDKNFPNVSREVLEGLIEVNRKGGTAAFGMFHNGTVYIAENAEAGTTYHEAFHATFRLFNSDKERSDLLEEAKKRYKAPTKEDLNNLNDHNEGLTNDQLEDLYYEEKMAEEFQEYKMTEYTSAKGKIKKFFRDLLNYIKSIFNGRIYIEQLFNRMDKGYYANKEPFHRDTAHLGGAAYNEIRGMNETQIRNRTKAINDKLFNHIDTIRKEYPFYNDMSDTDIINSLNTDEASGLEELYIGVWEEIYFDTREDIKNALKESNASEAELDEIDAKIDDWAHNFLQFDDNGNLSKRGDLFYRAVRDLQNYGLKFKFDKGANAENVETQDYSVVEENIDTREQWQVDQATVSGKDTISQRMKRVLSTIKEPDSFDDLGIQKSVDFDELFNYLKRNLSGTPFEKDLFQKLEDLAEYKPAINDLINKLEENEMLKSQFFTAFNNSFSPHLSIFRSNQEEMVVTYSNQNNISNVIINDWKSNAESSKIKNNDGTVNTEKAQELLNKYDDEINKVKRKLTDLNKSDLKGISEILGEMGINIDADNLYDAYEKGRVTKNIGSKKASAKNNISSILMEGNSIRALINTYKTGNDPFEGKGYDIITKLASLKALRANDLFEDSFVDSQNKMKQTHLPPHNLSLFVDTMKSNRREGFVKDYMQDPFYYNSPWLRYLRDNDEIAHELEFAMLDSIQSSLFTKKLDYESMNREALMGTKLSAWYNRGRNYSYYMLPIQSDRTNAYFVKFKKYDNIDDVVDELYSVAMQEKSRMEDTTLDGYDIKNFSSNKNKYMLLPFMEDFSKDIKDNPQEAKQHIKDKMSEEFEEFYNELDDTIKTYTDKNIRKDSKSLEDATFKNNMQLFYFSDYLASTQLGTLLVGDPAFYENKDDFYKRVGQATAPGTFMNLASQYKDGTTPSDNRRVVYMEDSKLGGEESIYEEVKEGLINNGFSRDYAEDVAKAFGVDEKVNETDAQSFITLDEYKRMMVGFGRWNERMENAYSRAKRGEALEADIDLIFQTLKPFNTGFEKIEGSNNHRKVPFQHKNSEAVLLPQLAKINGEDSKLDKMLKWMENKNIHALHFESAVKQGLYNVHSLEDIDNNVEPQIHNIPNKTLRIQNEVPVHGEGEEITFNSQIRRIITSDLPSDIETESTKGAENIRSEFEDLVAENVREAFRELKSQFDDIYKLRDTLLEEVEDREFGDEMRKALEIETDSNGNPRFRVELYNPVHSKRTEQLLNSIFKNRVNQQTINGEQLVQQTAYGFRDNLNVQFKRDENGKIIGVDHFEAYLPWKYKSIDKPVDSEGNIDESMISDEARRAIAHAMPYEDKYSSVPVKIKGFLPEGAPQSILLPSEFITITDNDFDIDKLFTLMPNIETRRNYGNITKALKDEGFEVDQNALKNIMTSEESTLSISERNIKERVHEMVNSTELARTKKLYTIDTIKYDTNKSISENSKEQRDNRMIEMIDEILTNSTTFNKLMEPGGFENLKEMEKEIRKKKASGKDRGIFSPSTQLEMYDRVMTGAKLVGIAANHNTHHALSQYSKLSPKIPVLFDDISENEWFDSPRFNKTFTFDGNERISKNIASILAASVDNLKEPVAGGLNLNTATADVAAFILRAGYPMETAINFINQPAVEEYVKKVNQGIDASEAAKGVLNNIRDRGNFDGPTKVFQLKNSKLKNNIGKNIEDNLELNFQVMSTFSIYREASAELSEMIQGSKADAASGAIGPTIADNELKIDRANTVMLDGFDMWENADTTIDNSSMVSAFINEGIIKPNNIFTNGLNKDGEIISSEYLESGSDYGNGWKGYYPWSLPGFRRIRKEIEREFNGVMRPNDVDKIHQQALSYIMAGHSFFDMPLEERQRVLNELPDQIRKINESNSALSNNALISRLKVRTFSDPKYSGAKNSKEIIFSNTGNLSESEQELIIKNWEHLLNTPEYQQLGEDLVKYNFIKNGLQFGKNSFGNLIPVSFISKLEREEGLRDLLDKEIQQAKDFTLSENRRHHFSPFVDRFFRNNYDDNRLVPKFKEGDEHIEVLDRGKVNGKNAKTPRTVIKKGGLTSKFILDSKNGNLFTFAREEENGYVYTITHKYGIPGHMKEWSGAESVIPRNNIQVDEQPQIKTPDYNEGNLETEPMSNAAESEEDTEQKEETSKKGRDGNILSMREEPIDYTEDQKEALNKVQKFIEGNDKFYLFSGYAGTGKTTVAENILKEGINNGYSPKILAPTHKAAKVLSDKLDNKLSSMISNVPSPSTIHAEIYGEPNEKGEWKPDEMEGNTLYLIDESSMIDEDMLNDIKEYLPDDSKVVFVGDSFQLEPVGKDPDLFKWKDREFSNENRSELAEVKRQSKNTLLETVTAIRTNKKAIIPNENTDSLIIEDSRNRISDKFKKSISNNEDSVMIVSTNKDKVKYNNIARRAKFGDKVDNNPLVEGEIIMGASNADINNSELATVQKINEHRDEFTVQVSLGNNIKSINFVEANVEVKKEGKSDTENIDILLSKDLPIASLYGAQLAKSVEQGLKGSYNVEKFTHMTKKGKIRWSGPGIVTYGYASTAHKAQGSQWNKVFIDQSYVAPSWNNARWLYTAMTRAEDEVHILPNDNMEQMSTDQIRKSIEKVDESVNRKEEDENVQDTSSNKVQYISYSELKDGKVFSKKGINTMRVNNREPYTFGNPFTGTPSVAAKNPDLILVGNDSMLENQRKEEAGKTYKDWLKGEKYTETLPEKREWILDQINNTDSELNQSLRSGKSLLYMNQGKNYYSHADALNEIINEKGEEETQKESFTQEEEVIGNTESRISLNRGVIRASGDPNKQLTNEELDQFERDTGYTIENILQKRDLERTVGYILKNYCS